MGRLLNFIFKKKREDFQKLTKERSGIFKLPDDVVHIKDIRYDRKYPERKLDVYRPSDTSRKYPVIVNVHGGGLVMGNKEFNTYFCAQLAKLGFIIFSVEYRLIPNTKIYGQWDDVSRAMDFVAEIAPSFDGDMSNVYMVGDSAGALLIVYALALQKNRRFANTANVRPCTKLNVNAVALSAECSTRHDLMRSGCSWQMQFGAKASEREVFAASLIPGIAASPNICRHVI
jgi:acetyl esterase/lipase